ncbi:MAG TPA: protein kinase [Bryobacteraceae bacterium]|nr:protein kinase [Bryobacteraceae bacterium]
MSLNPGARLGAYEVVNRLGAGAMGEVYRARDTRLGREVALKILPAEFAESADRRRRFEQESRAASALNHPNIVTVHDVGDQDGVLYIALELVDGESLRALIERGPVPARKAMDIGAQIADGLASAHAAGITHRDLKPENVMLTKDGRAKILDFGLARYQPPAQSEGTMTVTQPGMVMGTVGYMSPEQVMGTPADPRSDIFALGVILHEMLTGKLPFERATTVETMSAILRDEPSEMPATLVPAMQQVVLHCLEKEPPRRFQSATDLAFNLRALAATGSVTGSTISAAPQVPLAQPSRRRVLPFVTLLLAAIAGGALVLVFTLPPRGVDLSKYRFTPLATDSQVQAGAAWSPDGKNIAYVRGVDGGEDQVLVRSLDSLVPVVVSSANSPKSLFWSPDGSRVYFVANGGIWSVSRAGGEKQQVLKGDIAAATLSPDGKSLVYWLSLGERDKVEPKVWVSSPPGNTPRKYEPAVLESNGSFLPVYLRFSPDGKRILVSMTQGSGPQLWLLPFPDGSAARAKPRQILTKALSGAAVPGVSWMADSRHFVMDFSSASHPQRQLWMADSRSDALEQLTAGEGMRDSPAVSPDGTKIAFDSSTYDMDIVEIPLAGGPLRSLIATSRDELFPAWSPKGSQLAFVTDRSGAHEIWLKSTQEGWERPLVTQRDFPGDETQWLLTPAFSPDGSRIAYSRISNKHIGELWISPVGGGSPVRLNNSDAYQIAPSWSPDGKWIVYFSSDDGLMKAAVGGSEPAVALGFSSGCENPAQWSPDGQWIACATDGAVALVSPDGKTRRTVGHRTAFITWSRDGKEIYALGKVEGGRSRFGAIDVKSGVERTIYEYGPEVHFATAFNPAFPLSLSPDGKWLATTVLNARSDIWLLEGFGRR